MAYQSNFGETVDIGNVNVGRSNSARGEGTTTPELVTKVRSMNCAASLSVLIFHTLPRVLNPIRLVMLISSPIRLIIEILVASLALSLLLVEARIPVFGEKVISHVRGISAGGIHFIDLNVASGRVLALSIMTGLLALANLMTMGFFSTLSFGHGQPPSEYYDPTNATAVNNTQSDFGKNISNASPGPSPLFIFIQCVFFSPTIVLMFMLIMYTLYLMQYFPEFARSTAYESLSSSSGSDASTTITPVTDSGRPSWVSNIWSNSNVRGSGYQSLDV